MSVNEIWGEVFSYEFPSEPVRYKDVLSALSDNGFPLSYCPPIKTEAAFMEACKLTYKRWTAKKIYSDPRVTGVEFVRKPSTRCPNPKDENFVVVLTKRSGVIECDDKPRAAGEIEVMMNAVINRRTSSELYAMTRKVLSRQDIDAYPIDRASTSQFVPAEFSAKLTAVSNFVTDLGGTPIRLPLMKGLATNREGMRCIVQHRLTEQCLGYEANLLSYGKDTKLATVVKSLQRAKALQARIPRAEKQTGANFSGLQSAANGLVERFNQLKSDLREGQKRLENVGSN